MFSRDNSCHKCNLTSKKVLLFLISFLDLLRSSYLIPPALLISLFLPVHLYMASLYSISVSISILSIDCVLCFIVFFIFYCPNCVSSLLLLSFSLFVFLNLSSILLLVSATATFYLICYFVSPTITYFLSILFFLSSIFLQRHFCHCHARIFFTKN